MDVYETFLFSLGAVNGVNRACTFHSSPGVAVQDKEIEIVADCNIFRSTLDSTHCQKNVVLQIAAMQTM